MTLVAQQTYPANAATKVIRLRPASRPRAIKVMLFTDTLGDVNGVSRFINNAATEARCTGRELRVITSTNFAVPQESNIVNMEPCLAMKMPGYANLEFALPPVMPLLKEARMWRPDVIHVSTPGPVGLAGVLAARRLGVPVLGVYHTDFPSYISHLFQDEVLTEISSRYMRWFYKGFARIFARSRESESVMSAVGIGPERTTSLRPGIRTADFGPRFANRAKLAATCGGMEQTTRVLYVGRLSVEKNMPLLASAWRRVDSSLRAEGIEAQLVVVGDGPYRARMQADLKDWGCRAFFPGFLYGAELAMWYASCDFFAFPSTTDTLGQVVMEAQASGLATIVSDRGGPRQMVQQGENGFIISGNDVRPWIACILDLVKGAHKRTILGKAALALVQRYSMSASFEHFWEEHERASESFTNIRRAGR